MSLVNLMNLMEGRNRLKIIHWDLQRKMRDGILKFVFSIMLLYRFPDLVDTGNRRRTEGFVRALRN
jgi:hypothetical protein